jgi:hypothetical protein
MEDNGTTNTQTVQFPRKVRCVILSETFTTSGSWVFSFVKWGIIVRIKSGDEYENNLKTANVIPIAKNVETEGES